MTGPAAPVRVLVVEDDRVVQTVARAVIDADDRLQLVGCTGSISAALSALSADDVVVVLLDQDLPDGDAGMVVRHLRDTAPGVAVLLHTARHDGSSVARALGVPHRPKGSDWQELLGELSRLGAPRR